MNVSLTVPDSTQSIAVGVDDTGRPPRPLALRVLRRPLGAICLAFLLVVAGIAVIAPLLLPGIAAEQAGDLLGSNQMPSAGHPLGTDMVGRDVLGRLLVGAAPTMTGVLQALIVVTLIGVPLGLIAGYCGGWIDRVVVWTADLVFSVPTIAIIVVVLAVFPANMTAAMVTFGVLSGPILARVVRAATLSSSRELYVDGARVSGLTGPVIVVRHVLPRVGGVIVVQVSMLASIALATQVGLSFLRLVIANPAPSWGGMIADGVTSISSNPWLIWPPGIVVAVTVLAFGLLGDVIRDAMVEPWSTERTAEPAVRSEPKAARSADDAVRLRAGELMRIAGLGVSARRSGAAPVRLVENVSFRIAEGECLGLVGESGCGKSITASALLGVLPQGAYADAGGIAFDGVTGPWSKAVPGLRGRDIAFISQEPLVSLDPAYTVGAQLMESIRTHRRVGRRHAREIAVDLLRSVELDDPDAVMRRFPHELSGGMAQRVSIARSLSGDPRLLVADEPTTALDVTVQAEVLKLLMRLKSERNMSILLITHDWGVVAETCDRAIVMYAGQVVEESAVVELFENPRHPYTQGLLASDPHRATPGDRLPAIDGAVPQPGRWPEGCRFAARCPLAGPDCLSGPIELVTVAGGGEARCVRVHESAQEKVMA